ncbi:MAG TPA: hypothetical protein VI248_24605 [Kineosporiaceae bacterium]
MVLTPEPGRRGALAAVGPFFSVDVHEPGTAPGPGWRRWSDLSDAPSALRARVEAVRAALAAGGGREAAEIPVAVAASVVQLGLSARLVSPLLALAALHQVDLVPSAADVHWQDTLGGAVPLSLPADVLDHVPCDVPDWPRWADALVSRLLGGLGRAVCDLTPSRHTRAGNLASAVHGAVTGLTSRGSARIAAEAAARAHHLGRLLLAQPTLRGAAVGDPGTPGFRRRNCCLIYRAAVPDPTGRVRAVCGDCILTRS